MQDYFEKMPLDDLVLDLNSRGFSNVSQAKKMFYGETCFGQNLFDLLEDWQVYKSKGNYFAYKVVERNKAILVYSPNHLNFYKNLGVVELENRKSLISDFFSGKFEGYLPEVLLKGGVFGLITGLISSLYAVSSFLEGSVQRPEYFPAFVLSALVVPTFCGALLSGSLSRGYRNYQVSAEFDNYKFGVPALKALLSLKNTP